MDKAHAIQWTYWVLTGREIPSVVISLPPDFVSRLHHQISDAEQCLVALDSGMLNSRSVLLNPFALGYTEEEDSYPTIPWNPLGRRMPQETNFTKSLAYHLGLLYPMEASSMMIYEVLKHCSLSSRPRILDACAAPGGKTTVIKQVFPKSSLVAAEIFSKRAAILQENVERLRLPSTAVVHTEPSAWASIDILFDLIVVDAPCSGEGLFRKSPSSRNEWTAQKAAGCASRQRELLSQLLPSLEPGGYLVYSTCTFNPDENIDILKWLNREHGLSTVPMQNLEKYGAVQMDPEETVFGYQCFPHKVKGEGFFVALLQSEGNLILSETEEDKHLVFKSQNTKSTTLLSQVFECFPRKCLSLGIPICDPEKRYFPPLALAEPTQYSDLQSVALSRTEVMQYMEGQALPKVLEKGYCVLTYRDFPVGFGKSIGTRINTLWPKHRRVRW